MAAPRNRALTPAELQAFGDELDGLRVRTVATLGEADARYIRRIVAAVRYTGLAGRALLFLGAFVHSVLWPAWIAGVALLTIALRAGLEWRQDRMHSRGSLAQLVPA